MDQNSMRDALATAVAELEDIERQISGLRKRADALRQIRAGMESYLAMTRAEAVPAEAELKLQAQPIPTGPRGKDAVKLVLQDFEGKGLAVPRITREIVERGWIDSDNALDATRTNVRRAMHTWPENIKRVGHGVYTWVSNPQVASQPGGEDVENAEGPASTAGPSDATTNGSAGSTAGAHAEGGDGSDDEARASDLPAHHPASVAG